MKEEEKEKTTMKKEICSLCDKEYEIEEYITEPSCPDCFNGCCDPNYHDGACDGSC